MFTAVGQKTVIDAVREQLRSLIIRGQLTPGSKLPTEKELIRQLGVSRPALREALHTLSGEGLLEIRQGRGTYVRKPSSASAIRKEVVSLLLLSEDLKEIQEVRRILEPEIAARAAQNASDEELNNLEVVLTKMEEHIRAGQSIFDSAWDFHRGLARAAGNSAMGKIIDVLYEMIRVYEQRLYDRHFDPLQEIRNHRELLQAIRRRNPGQARVAMKAHLGTVDEGLNSALVREQLAADAKPSKAS